MVVGGALALDDDDQFEVQQENGQKGKRLSLAPNQKPPNIIYLMTVLSAMGGFLFGYDTGIVGGAMLFLRDTFQLSYEWQEIVVSITILGAWAFSLCAGSMSENYGRKTVIIWASVIFTFGSIVMGAAYSKYVLLFGRLIVGFAIGLASTVVPMYIAEVAPANIRGSLVTLNNCFITFGQLSANVTAGAFSFDPKNGWRWMLALAAVPSVIQFIGFIFMPESPRWLIRQDRNDEALVALKKIRGEKNPYVMAEFEKLKRSQVELRAQEERRKSQNRNIIDAIFMKSATRRALIIGCVIMAAQQLAGINTIMYYAPTIIEMSGVQSQSAAVWLSVPTSAVYVIFSISGCLIADRMKRRTLLLSSLMGVIISLIILGMGFQLRSTDTASVQAYNSTNKDCSYIRDCAICIENKHCGFCWDPQSPSNGASCLLADDSGKFSIGGACEKSHSASSSYIFIRRICPQVSKGIGLNTWLVLAGLVIYLASFAPGMGPMPWTINSEIYPMWARSFCYSMATSVNWFFNLLISLTFIHLTEWLTKHGAFYLYAIISGIFWIILFLELPETRGLSLEDISSLFAKSKSDDQDVIEEQANASNQTTNEAEQGLGFNQLGLIATQMATGGHRHSIVVCHDNLAFAAENLPVGKSLALQQNNSSKESMDFGKVETSQQHVRKQSSAIDDDQDILERNRSVHVSSGSSNNNNNINKKGSINVSQSKPRERINSQDEIEQRNKQQAPMTVVTIHREQQHQHQHQHQSQAHQLSRSLVQRLDQINQATKDANKKKYSMDGEDQPRPH